MRSKKLILLLVLLLALGSIAMAGCGEPPEDDFDLQEDPFADPGGSDDPLAEPDNADDPFNGDGF